jgi:hypothetical protein
MVQSSWWGNMMKTKNVRERVSLWRSARPGCVTKPKLYWLSQLEKRF